MPEPKGCRRFCSCQSRKEPQSSIAFNEQSATDSYQPNQPIYEQQVLTRFQWSFECGSGPDGPPFGNPLDSTSKSFGPLEVVEPGSSGSHKIACSPMGRLCSPLETSQFERISRSTSLPNPSGIAPVAFVGKKSISTWWRSAGEARKMPPDARGPGRLPHVHSPRTFVWS